ncbi:MAG: Holliday junction resolvase RuvX [Oscillospiraceae bacterium]|jgi:putative Holliday junction resolvase|nr:Holliday junction resolvase RuvX [Oscillospiraceae bacterium]
MKIMAVDVGSVRTGLAVSESGFAFPVCVIQERNFKECVKKVCEKAIECKAEKIVVGYPKNMNNTVGPRAKLSEEFAAELGRMSSLPVQLWDERNTTKSAVNCLNATDTRGKKRKAVIDAVAAVIILQSYLDSPQYGNLS